MSARTIPLKDLEVYKLSHSLGAEVWELVANWSYFNKDVLGKQLVRAADSISLNISEGYGRYHFKENKQFCYYARGSLFETSECLVKANERNLIEAEKYKEISSKMNRLKVRLNNYIASIGTEKK